jgi:hypothetical protein
MAAHPNWPVAADTREPAAAVDEAVGAAMAGTEATVLPETLDPAAEMPAFSQMTKTELLGYCVENDPEHEGEYLAMTKAELLTEAESIWTELYGPNPAQE